MSYNIMWENLEWLWSWPGISVSGLTDWLLMIWHIVVMVKNEDAKKWRIHNNCLSLTDWHTHSTHKISASWRNHIMGQTIQTSRSWSHTPGTSPPQCTANQWASIYIQVERHLLPTHQKCLPQMYLTGSQGRIARAPSRSQNSNWLHTWIPTSRNSLRHGQGQRMLGQRCLYPIPLKACQHSCPIHASYPGNPRILHLLCYAPYILKSQR
jgi:hypothetical protein